LPADAGAAGEGAPHADYRPKQPRRPASPARCRAGAAGDADRVCVGEALLLTVGGNLLDDDRMQRHQPSAPRGDGMTAPRRYLRLLIGIASAAYRRGRTRPKEVT